MSDYYEILNEEDGLFQIRLNEQADVYRGHFPGQPIAPGACNIEMIRELASRLAGRELHLKEITQCRFTHLIRPEVENPLEVRVRLEGDKLTAGISHGETVCVTMKARVVIVNS